MSTIRSISRLPAHACYVLMCDSPLGNYDWYYSPTNNCHYAVFKNVVYRIPVGKSHSAFIHFLYSLDGYAL